MRNLEVIALNADDAYAAQQAGATRIELVSNMAVGGLSPSVECVKQVVAKVNIPVNVMVRLSSESFIYSETEFGAMLEYINQIKDLGINGIVFGSLNSDLTICESQLEQVITKAGDLDITFHRAIDESTVNYMQNIDIVSGRVTTVLTSGGQENPLVENIERLMSASKANLQILVGGGITAENYQYVISQLPACDIHIGSLAYNQNDFEKGINQGQVKKVREVLNMA